jgi:hypothetical protein
MILKETLLRSGAMAKKTFVEIGRIEGDIKDIVVSEVHGQDGREGIVINSFIKTDKYTGFAEGSSGVIKNEDIAEFKRIIDGID